ncbi:helix-turn-helix domain-containing protein [Longispora fulva]|uniref:DNA-binding CsgD family transcriptional regulator n=1 Tax=Longispora fulva TaxID=619741 RepID=A0A8J7GDU3_9ACTN|nr:helix-turn-helix transcriptional regulator [Longispora fulva]MBG6135836.1 DNA-binding CsgD family transcriptional regulator [Longispora fulva]
MIPVLTRWGLSAQADLVYRTLVSQGPQTASGLAVQLGLGVRAARLACEELAACGAVAGESSSEGGRRWRAHSASGFLDSVRQRHLNAAHARAVEQQRRASLAGYARVRELTGFAGEKTGLTPLHGGAAVRGRIAQLAAGERFEHLAMAPEPIYDPAAVAAAAPLDLDLLARGVRLRTLEHTTAAGGGFGEHTNELARLGARQRVLATVPAKMIIYDRRVALLPMDPANTQLGAVEVDEPVVVDALVAMFEQAWDRAVSYGEHAGTTPLNPREQAIMRLLLEGHTDAAMARTLGLSARTLQYTIRSVMDRLGVNTRFALGHALGRLGHDLSSPLGKES